MGQAMAAATGGRLVRQEFSRTVTLSDSMLATATSGLPSPLKSPAAMDLGSSPTSNGELAAALNSPLPSPKKSATLLEVRFATAKSRFPSPLKSATATENGILNPSLTRA